MFLEERNKELLIIYISLIILSEDLEAFILKVIVRMY